MIKFFNGEHNLFCEFTQLGPSLRGFHDVLSSTTLLTEPFKRDPRVRLLASIFMQTFVSPFLPMDIFKVTSLSSATFPAVHRGIILQEESKASFTSVKVVARHG